MALPKGPKQDLGVEPKVADGVRAKKCSAIEFGKRLFIGQGENRLKNRRKKP